MDHATLNVFSFDQGLERLQVVEPDRPSPLPQTASPLLPTTRPADAYLDRLLHSATIEDQLLLEPLFAVRDRHILLPQTYRGLLARAGQTMEREAGDSPTAESSRIFAEAAFLLRAELSLTDLLESYRNALHKG